MTLSKPGLTEGYVVRFTIRFFIDAINVQVFIGMYNDVQWHRWMKTGEVYQCINGTERVYSCVHISLHSKMLPQPGIKLLCWPLYH